ncbi:MAG: DUF2723 domain-containing protein [Patescibacteria group bacterium]|nr:DUF2723 domain-containing protein [Patescibacteria group bacterium]
MLSQTIKKSIFPAVVFLSTFLTYVLTMPRTIYLGDNAEYITVSAVLGIPHPSGYPLFVILGKLFSLLPVSTLAFRVNLLSAAAGGTALVVFYFVALRAFRFYQQSSPAFHFPESAQKLSALAVCLLLGFSPWFWNEATVAQVYSLHFLFFVLLFWLVLKFWEKPKSQLLLWGALLSGLGLANHEMLVLLLPFFFAAVAVQGSKSRWPVKLGMLGLFLLGLSVYLYLPLRSLAHPAYQWGNVSESLSVFINHIVRSDYGDLGGLASISDKARYVYDFLLSARDQFGWLALWSLFGIVALFRSEKRLLLFVLSLIFGNVGGIVLLRDVPYSEVGGLIFTKYCLTSFALLALLIGLGAVEIFRLFAPYWKKLSRFPHLAAIVILAPALAAYPLAYAQNDLSNFNFLENYSAEVLKSLPENSVLAVSYEGASTDSGIFSLLYQQAVQKLRPDVSVVGLPQVFANSDFESLNRIMRTGTIDEVRTHLVEYVLSHARYTKRPIYTTFLVETLKPNNEWESYSNGYVYRLVIKGQPAPAAVTTENILTDSDRTLLERNAYGQDMLAQYDYAKASELIQNGDFKGSQDLYIKAIALEDDPAGMDIFAYRAHRDVFLGQKKK